MNDKEKLVMFGGGLLALGALWWLMSGLDDVDLDSLESEVDSWQETLEAPAPVASVPSTPFSPASLWSRVEAHLNEPWSYREGGVGDDGTIDCSGLPFRAARDLGVNVERRASMQAASSQAITEDRAKQTAGSLVFFHRPGKDNVFHVEVSDGQGSVVGALTGGGKSIKRQGWGWWDSWNAKRVRQGKAPAVGRVSFGLLGSR